MVYYADYEALEFNSLEAKKRGIFPYYLDYTKEKSALCPLYLSISNNKGEIIEEQSCFKRNISFLSFLDNQVWKLRYSKFKEILISFHNLNYDFRIIIHELFYRGFKQIFIEDKIQYLGEYLTEYKKGSFEIIGQNLSKYVGINIYYKALIVKVRDTMSILNSSQDKILKDFGYSKKIDVDWNSINLDNLTQNMELIANRCNYDVTSLAKCIEEFKSSFYEHYKGKGLTASGMSLDAYKYYLCCIECEENADNETKEILFRHYYPVLNEQKKELSKGTYSGGICLVNPIWQGKLLENLQMLDINSSYPHSMTYPLPFGDGHYIQDFTNIGYSEYIIFVKFSHTGISFTRCHSENKARNLLGIEPLEKEKCYTRSQFPLKFEGYLCMNSIELRLLQKYAKVEKLKFLKGVNYQTNDLMADFINPIYEEKAKSTGVKKLATKLLMNSLYGKFAQDLSGINFNYLSLEDYTKVIGIDTDYIYKPLASAVTAYSRTWLVDMIYLLGDNFIYSDTDSVYFFKNKKTDELLSKCKMIDNNKLGYWSYEYMDGIKRGKFLSKKNYLIEKMDGELKLTCVGLSKKYHNQINFDNFEINSIPFKIQKMVDIYGGKAMRDTEFKIKRRV